MTSRSLFLATLRSRLATPAPANPAHPLLAVDEIPAIAYPYPLDDPVASFETGATALGTKVRRGTDLETVLLEVIQAHDVRSAVVSRDPECAGVADLLASAGVEILDFDGPQASADLGVTGAAWAIAATGTLVLDAGRAGGRSAGLVPPVHLALVRASNVLPDSSALFRQMRERWPDGPPSQFVLASGPSRSADIELTLTVGVHGPGVAWVGVLDG